LENRDYEDLYLDAVPGFGDLRVGSSGIHKLMETIDYLEEEGLILQNKK